MYSSVLLESTGDEYQQSMQSFNDDGPQNNVQAAGESSDNSDTSLKHSSWTRPLRNDDWRMFHRRNPSQPSPMEDPYEVHRRYHILKKIQEDRSNRRIGQTTVAPSNDEPILTERNTRYFKHFKCRTTTTPPTTSYKQLSELEGLDE